MRGTRAANIDGRSARFVGRGLLVLSRRGEPGGRRHAFGRSPRTRWSCRRSGGSRSATCWSPVSGMVGSTRRTPRHSSLISRPFRSRTDTLTASDPFWLWRGSIDSPSTMRLISSWRCASMRRSRRSTGSLPRPPALSACRWSAHEASRRTDGRDCHALERGADPDHPCRQPAAAAGAGPAVRAPGRGRGGRCRARSRPQGAPRSSGSCPSRSRPGSTSATTASSSARAFFCTCSGG